VPSALVFAQILCSALFEAYRTGIEKHLSQEFLCPDEYENWFFDAEQDDGTDREVTFMGEQCPMDKHCKSYKAKLSCCRSMLGEDWTRNYYAQHLVKSSNHNMSIDQAFSKANELQIHRELWTADQRKAYTQHEADKAKNAAAKGPAPPNKSPPKHLLQKAKGTHGKGKGEAPKRYA